MKRVALVALLLCGLGLAVFVGRGHSDRAGRAPRGGGSKSERPAAADIELGVEAISLASIRVRVVADKSLTPIADAEIWLVADEPIPDGTTPDGVAALCERTDDRGEAGIPVTAEAWARPHSLVVNASGFIAHREPVPVRGWDGRRTITLGSGAEMVGRIVNAAGEGVPGVTVRVLGTRFKARPPSWSGPALANARESGGQAASDEDGVVRITGLLREPHVVEVLSDDWSTLSSRLSSVEVASPGRGDREGYDFLLELESVRYLRGKFVRQIDGEPVSVPPLHVSIRDAHSGMILRGKRRTGVVAWMANPGPMVPPHVWLRGFVPDGPKVVWDIETGVFEAVFWPSAYTVRESATRATLQFRPNKVLVFRLQSMSHEEWRRGKADVVEVAADLLPDPASGKTLDITLQRSPDSPYPALRQFPESLAFRVEVPGGHPLSRRLVLAYRRVDGSYRTEPLPESEFRIAHEPVCSLPNVEPRDRGEAYRWVSVQRDRQPMSKLDVPLAPLGGTVLWVTDDEQDPLSWVDVYVRDSAETKVRWIPICQRNRYRCGFRGEVTGGRVVLALPAGRYEIMAHKPGFAIEKQELAVENDELQPIRIQLRRE